MYCAYLRKSRADRDAEARGEGETLARHKTLLLDTAARMKLTIKQFYSEVVSGESIDNRPEMKKLLQDVETGMWEGVFVVEVERLARGNTRDQGIVSDTFKYSGTKIITPFKIYDPENEFDEEYFEFGLFMSRREYKTINRRLQRGRIASLQEGKYIAGMAPYGYEKVKIPHDKGYTLKIVEPQADIVRKIYHWYCHGETLADGSIRQIGSDIISRKLNESGITPPGAEKWTKSSVMDILRNPTYAGKVAFGRRKEVKSTSDGKIIKMCVTNHDYIEAQGLHPAIIPPQLFELACSVRSNNRKSSTPASKTLQNPFQGLIYCTKCGAVISRLGTNAKNRYETLRCSNKSCGNVSSPLFLIEEHILSFLRNWLETYEVNGGFTEESPLENEIKESEHIVQRIDSDIASTSKQMEKAYEMLEKEVYTIEIFKHRQQTLQSDIDRLKQRRSDVEDNIISLKRAIAERERFAPAVRHLLDTYQENSPEENNRILKEVIEKIYYEKNEPNRRGNIRNANFKLDIFPKLPS